VAQRSAILGEVGVESGLVDGGGIEQAEDEAMQIAAGVKDVLKIVGELAAVGLHRVVH
jgi:hypothetical protein